FHDTLKDNLFDGSSALYTVLIVAVLAYAASYFARGFLAGNRRLALYGALVFLESVARCTFAFLAVVGVTDSQSFVAAGMALAPLQLFQAIQTAILPHLTELSAGAAVEDFRHSVAVTVRAIAAFGALVTLGLLAVGPFAMHVLFGDKGFDYQRLGLVAMGAGMGLYLVGATLNQAALARGRATQAAGCWAISAAGYVVFLLLPLFHDKVVQLEVAYLCGA